MLPETASLFCPDSFQICLMIWQVAGFLIGTAVTLFISDTRLKPVLRLQEGGANVGQKSCGLPCWFL